MEDILKILDKIENPLIFLSRNSYKNLAVVRDLERTMSGFLDELKAAFLSHYREASSADIPEDAIQEFHKTFQGFDSLSISDKKKRVDNAFVYIKELKSLCSDQAPVISDDSGIQPEKNLNECFRKLSTDVQYIKGVGPKMGALLGRKRVAERRGYALLSAEKIRRQEAHKEYLFGGYWCSRDSDGHDNGCRDTTVQKQTCARSNYR